MKKSIKQLIKFMKLIKKIIHRSLLYSIKLILILLDPFLTRFFNHRIVLLSLKGRISQYVTYVESILRKNKCKNNYKIISLFFNIIIFKIF